ncbi:nucleotidyltransferase [Mesorhizobium sp. PAMC28654]|uniref:nucleotidyltransferase domain-containing protein n=1 Tax=Mesorhizobium sp. PAMC28654 TaxID=2880934 RepID=UPI001D0AD1C3|nr:nucleotidyltransferase [Mesorhizobium sp. PAMC28654]UDL90698.1 nucleotidyltransferase [Mesorhizobium sp. PAMC28654]
MPINEAQLVTWSAQGSVQQSAATYQTVRGVLNDAQSPYYPKSFDIFLQGSYGNDTNIYADSDVDVVIRLDSIFYTDTSGLSGQEKSNYESNRSSAEYSLAKFKEEVGAWLVAKFGSGVKPGNKAIFVPGNGSSRRDADVLPCAEHRYYTSYPAAGSPTFLEGVVFWAKDGTKIVNYPKQHSENCTTKHQATNGYFKPTVRIFKNMRNRMIENGLLKEGLAPSYYLEGLLWNVPYNYYGSSFQQTVTNCINFINASDTSQFHCANGIHWLLRDGYQVCWSPANFTTFMAALQGFWNDNGGKPKTIWL